MWQRGAVAAENLLQNDLTTIFEQMLIRSTASIFRHWSKTHILYTSHRADIIPAQECTLSSRRCITTSIYFAKNFWNDFESMVMLPTAVSIVSKSM